MRTRTCAGGCARPAVWQIVDYGHAISMEPRRDSSSSACYCKAHGLAELARQRAELPDAERARRRYRKTCARIDAYYGLSTIVSAVEGAHKVTEILRGGRAGADHDPEYAARLEGTLAIIDSVMPGFRAAVEELRGAFGT